MINNDDTNDLVHSLRSGTPELCDFCNEPIVDGQVVAEEAGQWACPRCWARFEAEDQERRLMREGIGR